MKSTLYSLLSLTVLSIFAVSCDNELDVNAPFEETTVVYATLDASTSVNYIRVTRAYLGDEGIFGGNDLADSLYYDSLDVQLIGRNQSGNIVQQVTAVKDPSITLDTGFFTTQGYTAYRINGNLNEDLVYEVVVTRPDDNAQIRAETQMVQDFAITQPRFPTVNPAGIRGQEVAWDQAVNGRVYNANMHLRYVEFPRNNKADSSRHTVTYSFPYVTGDNEDGIGEISSFITLDQFYGNIAAKLVPPTGNRIRIARRVDVEVVAGADDLATYINVSQPQSGVLQDPPLFTNVQNGVGIVSSVRRSFELNKRLANASLEELVFGDYTCDLRFGKVTTSDTLFCQP
ncbi:DUF4249 family protein [Phaeocystidibacter luteus]|uniref:DUF4249 family protein n=1 Tax=Phaeocystidibacter luteus TaxID=911197 RepID=A0A6N6RM46_9FLAO|nr:DUF4249 family protein [Phaeocystidibacter luteus]KAB2814694.1 DUF4249 family protein [Phaeocystidibacter luteus]